jgi:hypothetical protein
LTWAKIDDRANEHRKQLAAGAEACWLWTCGLMYANRQPARDGFIPDAMVGMLYPFKDAKALAARLVKAGLWRKCSGGYRIHEFKLWNQTKEQLENEREKGRERAAKSYEKRKAKNQKSSPEEPPEEETKAQSEDEPKNSGSSPPRAQTRAGIPSDSAAATTPGEEDPPTPKPRDRMLESLTGGSPKKRPDVLALFGKFCELYGFAGAVLGLGVYNTDAETLAECIDARGMADCELVLKHSPTDGMVSGRDDERKQKHQTIRYIFGNQDAFNRILRAAREAERKGSGDVADLIARRKAQTTGGAA